jgi:hypothetical protein
MIVYRMDYKPTLVEAQDRVNGHVEVINIDENTQILANEDGHPLGLSVNEEATKMLLATMTGEGYGVDMSALEYDDCIVGNVIVLEGDNRWID